MAWDAICISAFDCHIDLGMHGMDKMSSPQIIVTGTYVTDFFHFHFHPNQLGMFACTGTFVTWWGSASVLCSSLF